MMTIMDIFLLFLFVQLLATNRHEMFFFVFLCAPVNFFIGWFFLCSLSLFSFSRFSLIMGTIPELKTTHFNMPAYLKNKSSRASLLSLWYFSILIPIVVLLPVSQAYFIRGDQASREMAYVCYTVGMAYMGINFLVASGVFLFFFRHFKLAAEDRLRAIRESTLSEEKEEYKLLAMTVSKLNRSSLTAIVLTPYYSLFSLLLAFDSSFFTTIPLSEAFIILTIIINDTPGLLLPINILIVSVFLFSFFFFCLSLPFAHSSSSLYSFFCLQWTLGTWSSSSRRGPRVSPIPREGRTRLTLWIRRTPAWMTARRRG